MVQRRGPNNGAGDFPLLNILVIPSNEVTRNPLFPGDSKKQVSRTSLEMTVRKKGGISPEFSLSPALEFCYICLPCQT